MAKKQKIQFIVNPVSGNNKSEDIHSLIKANFDLQKFEFDYKETKAKGHATELSAQAVKDDFDAVIACGGDGTVNEVAKSLVNTNTNLGILPSGSGNGFAMYIGMGRNSKHAILKLNKAIPKRIDSCYVNDEFFLNLAGVGFDALIAYKAENSKKRGLQMYVGMVSKEMINFKAEQFKIYIDNKIIEGEFTTVAVANAAMYGYNFSIAPQAELTDGLLDIVLVKKAPLLRTMGASWRMLNNSLDKSPLVEMTKSKEVTIQVDKPYYYHLDGESFSFEGKLHFRVNPMSINVLFPEGRQHMN